MVEFSEMPGMLRFLDLERDISRLVGMPVDLVQKEANWSAKRERGSANMKEARLVQDYLRELCEGEGRSRSTRCY